MNELSLRTQATDIQTARQWMSDLISTVRTATAQGMKKVIPTHSDFQGTVLAPDYPLVRWRNDNQIERQTRLFFKTLIIKAPFLTDVVDPEIENKHLIR